MVFNRKQWTLDGLISDVVNGRVPKSQATIWVNNYFDKGFFDEADVLIFEEATAEPEPVEMEEEFFDEDDAFFNGSEGEIC